MDDARFRSRKFILACAVFITTTVTMGALFLFREMPDPMPLLWWYLTAVSSVLTLYGGANVLEKRNGQ